jgi:HipA-like C-terminal domain
MSDNLSLQEPDQLVDVANWVLDDEFAIFPVGSKPKRALFCPTPAPYPFLIAGHRYLFKVSKDWRILQHWSEVIACLIAGLSGVRAASCFVAIDSRVDEVGVLVEFFYGYPGQLTVPRFITGADLLRRLVEQYEADPDRHHTVGNILALTRRLSDRFDHWGRLLAFDALIGNTDRHPENWGILAQRNQSGAWQFEATPSFDHGTSLAYQLRNQDIAGQSTDTRVQEHLRRGRHHARWSQLSPERGHFELCRLFAQTYPQAKPAMIGVLDFPMDQVEEALRRCERFELSEGRLIPARRHYLSKIIRARHRALQEALDP